jgi:general secretion pathway protein K
VRKGSALLAVLWLSAALSMIAFSLASTLRGEMERTGTAVDGIRAYYLAAGAIDRALLYIEWAPYGAGPDGRSVYYNRGTPRLDFNFPGGVATVEVIPESSKLNVNSAPPEQLFPLFLALGAGPERARDLALAIVDARTHQPLPPPMAAPGGVPTFQPRGASFQEIDDLLLVRGMTPELFYGTYERDEAGGLTRRPGARDCLTVHPGGGLDVNTAEPAVMAALGLPPQLIAAIVDFRKQDYFRTPEQVLAFAQGAPGAERLGLGGGNTYTLRATARLRLQDGRLSNSRRSVAALVKGPAPRARTTGYRILRWYDTVWTN